MSELNDSPAVASTSTDQLLAGITAALAEVILPNLQKIQESQAEQRFESETLQRSLEDFRSEMHLRFAELRAELAAFRAEMHAVIEDSLATQQEDDDSPTYRSRKLVN